MTWRMPEWSLPSHSAARASIITQMQVNIETEAYARGVQTFMDLYTDIMQENDIRHPVPLYVASGLLTYMQPQGERPCCTSMTESAFMLRGPVPSPMAQQACHNDCRCRSFCTPCIGKPINASRVRTGSDGLKVRVLNLPINGPPLHGARPFASGATAGFANTATERSSSPHSQSST